MSSGIVALLKLSRVGYRDETIGFRKFTLATAYGDGASGKWYHSCLRKSNHLISTKSCEITLTLELCCLLTDMIGRFSQTELVNFSV